MTIYGLKRGRAGVSSARTLRSALLTSLFALAWISPPLAAVEVTSLYTVEVALDPNDPNAQSNAYRAALSEVLVRVTGSTGAAESEDMAALFPNPTRYVRQFRSGADNTLTVTLDGPAIERTLRQAGATVWGSDRPLTIVWLAIDWGLGDREIVGAGDQDGDRRAVDRNQLLRERVQAMATRRGLPIVFPLLDVEDLQRIGFVDIWGGFDDPLLEASARYAADTILVGRIRPNEMQPPRWTWHMGEERFGWPGEPEEAVAQLADALAARDAIRGDEASEIIELTISGIDSVIAYGRVQQYMENLRVVDRLSITAAHPDRIVYQVELQGGLERLNNALSLSNILQEADTGYFIDAGPRGFDDRGPNVPPMLEYRYRPEPPPLPMEPEPVQDIRPER